LWEALRGNLKPYQIVVDGPSVDIQLDENGQPIGISDTLSPPTELPSDQIEIRRAGIALHQPNRRTITADEIHGQVRIDSNVILASAQIPQLLGGSWTLNAEYSPVSATLSASVESSSCPFDTDELVQLAGIPSWDPAEFQAGGTVRVDGSVSVTGEKKVTYHAKLQLQSGRARAAKNGIIVDQINGEWDVDNGLITFPMITAKIIGADIRLAGRLNITPGSEEGRVTVTLDGLAVNRLPIKSDAIHDLEGSLAGSAELELSAPNGKWQLEATGQGQLNNGAWRDIAIAQLTCQLALPPWMLAESLEPPTAGQVRLDFKIAEQDVSQVLRAVAPAAKFQEQDIAGKLSLTGDVTVPLQSVDQVDTFSANATLSANSLDLADLHVPQLVAHAHLADGQLEMPEITVQLQPTGRLTANGSVALQPDGLARLNVVLAEVPVSVAKPFVPDSLPEMAGIVNGSVEADVPWSSWNDSSRWRGTATVKSSVLDVDKFKFADLSTQVELKDHRVAFTNSKLSWQGAELQAQATLQLDQPLSFEANCNADEFDLQRLLKTAGVQAAEQAQGKLAVSGRVQGTLAPFLWNAGGQMKVSDLNLADRVAPDLEIPWSANATQLNVDDAKAELLGGTIHLSASVPWKSMERAQVDGRFEALHSDQLNEAFDNLPAELSGQVSGTFRASHFSSSRALQAHIDFRGLKAQAGVVQVSDMAGSLDAQDGTLTFETSGGAMDGKVSVSGIADFPASSWKPRVSSGSASLRNLSLQSLWPILGQQQRLGPLRAVADADLELVRGATRPTGNGQIQLRDVQWGTSTLTQAFTAQIELSDELFHLSNARCRLGQGVLTGDLRFRVGERKADIVLRGKRLPIDYLLAKWPKVARKSQGTLDAELTGVIGEQVDIRGRLKLGRGSFAGIPLRNVQAPVSWRMRPRSGVWEGNVELQNTRVASGTATGKWRIGWNGAFYLKGTTNVSNVDIRPLAVAVPDVNNLLSGRLTGNFSLESRDLRTPNDLNGSYRFQLEQTQTLLLPILESLTAALGLNSPTSLTFTRTDVVGHIGRGVIKVKEMSMVGPEARMWVVGQMGLGGVIDFEVTADTGGMSGVNLVAGAINPLELLRRRLVFLHLSGSIRNPIVQPRTEQFIAQELVLFFLPVISLR
jgi:hypothetical protein